jgi:hypothetical protein
MNCVAFEYPSFRGIDMLTPAKKGDVILSSLFISVAFAPAENEGPDYDHNDNSDY